ncbi:hypothetical protein M3Y98_01199300 [Aphelenchoides besseyi]|nr:hypothetical protein M3Y98_01199300 [Aphelenchoides besseyi]KAI6193132.1 hypothetical protein M3Y96_00985800 [Aphelenchoides besseyi]
METVRIVLFLCVVVGVEASNAVHGTRMRNSSVSLRSFVSDRRTENSAECEYCHPIECLKEKHKTAFCFVERDDEGGYGDEQFCADDDETVRSKVVGERLNDANSCQMSKKSPLVFVCWCKHTVKGRTLSRHDQAKERTAGRGQLQYVHLLSADSRPAQFESLLPANRPSANFNQQTGDSNSTFEPSARSKSAAASWNGHIAHSQLGSRPTPIRKTIPRRPSPARSFTVSATTTWFTFFVSILLVSH